MKELQETRVWVEAGGVCGRVTASPWVSDNCEPAPVETTLQNAFLTTRPECLPPRTERAPEWREEQGEAGERFAPSSVPDASSSPV